MIPDYKLYQGAVLAELIDDAKRAVNVRELVEEGRLHSYVLNERVGLHIKHSAGRLPPWLFTFTPANGVALAELRRTVSQVFVVLVCWLDGMVCLSLDELGQIVTNEQQPQGWVRAERRRNEWYAVSGSRGLLPYKKPHGLAPLVAALDVPERRTWRQFNFWRHKFE
jgi:hypothetical protein